MKVNIGFISLGTGGTMGHMSLITRLADKLSKDAKLNVLSEYNYENFSNVNNSKINFIKIPKQEHMKTVGGCLNYKFKEEIVKIVQEKNLGVVIFSTFFDIGLLKSLRDKKIKTILVSYPLRDSHRAAIISRKYYSLFDKVYLLNDILNVPELYPNEKLVSPILDPLEDSKNIDSIKNILITCGGGGRPSAERFFEIINSIVPSMQNKYPELKLTIIRGAYHGSILGGDILDWSNNFKDLLKEADLVISEAGYFTLNDLLALRKPAILIPGERRIDNQELRAVNFERAGAGIAFFPTEDPSRLFEIIEEFIKNPSKLNLFPKNVEKLYIEVSKLDRIDNSIFKEIK